MKKMPGCFVAYFNKVSHKLGLYAQLVRIDKPIGTLLLLWPTLWAIFAASQGTPDLHILAVFILGTFLMRSAGCAMNDYFDRDIDQFVKRTEHRVLTTGKITPKEALYVAGTLGATAFILVLTLNWLTIGLAFVAAFLAITYPLFKRFFAIPQAYLGIAFGFGIPMAFAAVTGTIPAVAWLMLIANVFWAMAYDTEYAMVDREDDLKLGLKTSAITFGQYDVIMVALCYATTLLLLAWCGHLLAYGWPYFAGLVVAATIAVKHVMMIRYRERDPCFRAFKNNNVLGGVIFFGQWVYLTFGSFVST
jgi:4-hydroxybenzoate polyprenyltransferase